MANLGLPRHTENIKEATVAYLVNIQIRFGILSAKHQMSTLSLVSESIDVVKIRVVSVGQREFRVSEFNDHLQTLD